MTVELKNVRNFKIVPENFEHSTVFEIKEIASGSIRALLPKITPDELNSYQKGANVEVFGLTKEGPVYFTTTVLENNKNELLIEYPKNLKELQRRKHSRVQFRGALKVAENENIKIKLDDISAGGLKFESDFSFIRGKSYPIKIELINNLTIECFMEAVRVVKTEDKQYPYSVSVKFKDMRSMDKIALLQYSMGVNSEMEHKLHK